MVKKGLLLKDLKPCISTSSVSKDWSLCVGAGISLPIFPDWHTLSIELAKLIKPTHNLNHTNLEQLSFSPDALIQMVKNTTNLSNFDFALKMSQALYKTFKSKIETSDWDDIVDVIDSTHLTYCSPKKWKTFIKYRDEILKETTAYSIACSIINSIENKIPPSSILSFNAEPLLYTILNSFIWEQNAGAINTSPKEIFCKVTSSLSHKSSKRIPYIFCHGLLPAADMPKAFTHSIDKLVFLEEEYLQLANNSFSWQATTFLNICTTQNIIFIGTSLTDPNMRRWLSWVHSNRIKEMHEHKISAESSTQHYWIRVIPKDQALMPWVEAAVAHLGVRLIWIEKWSEVSTAIEKLLGIYNIKQKIKNTKIKTINFKTTKKKRQFK